MLQEMAERQGDRVCEWMRFAFATIVVLAACLTVGCDDGGTDSSGPAGGGTAMKAGDTLRCGMKVGGRPQFWATGFVVGSDGHILTCAHAVKGLPNTSIKAGIHSVTVEIQAIDESLDLALLKAPRQGMATLRLAPKGLSAGLDSLTMCGPHYSWSPANGSFSWRSGGDVIAGAKVAAPVSGEQGWWRLNIPVWANWTGGPVMNDQGDVVGIINRSKGGQGMRATRVLDVTQIRKFLDANGVKYATGGAPIKPTLKELRAQTKNAVASIFFAPDNKAGQPEAWQPVVPRRLAMFNVHGKAGPSAWSPDGAYLAVAETIGGGGRSDVVIWDVKARERVTTLSDMTTGVTSLRFSADGKMLAATGWKGTVLVWKTDQWRLWNRTNDHAREVLFSPDSKLLVCVIAQGVAYAPEPVKIYGTADGKLKASVKLADLKRNGRISDVVFMPKRGLLLTCGDLTNVEGTKREALHLWDPNTAELKGVLPEMTPNVPFSKYDSHNGRIAISPDESKLAFFGWRIARKHDVAVQLAVQVYDMKTMRRIYVLKDDGYTIGLFQFSQNGRVLATSMRGSIRFYDAETGGPFQTMWSMAYSPGISPDNKQIIAYAGGVAPLHLFDIAEVTAE